MSKTDLNMIYQNPLAYIRALDKENLENEGNFPAYVAHKEGAEVPQRLLESGIKIMSTKSVSGF